MCQLENTDYKETRKSNRPLSVNILILLNNLVFILKKFSFATNFMEMLLTTELNFACMWLLDQVAESQ